MRLILFVAGLILAILAMAQPTASQQAATSFAGTWTAEMNGLAGAKMTIAEAGGKIGGTIVFYLQKRENEKAPWHVTSDYKTPILAPRVESKTLTFEVQHHTCDGCQELGPNVHFRVELTGPDEARMWRLEDGNDSPVYKLVRTM
jgi:hypothetical protein